MTWDFARRPTFQKQFQNLDNHIQMRVNNALENLARSKNPTDLGTYKPNMQVFAYNIGKYRIIFSVRYSENLIDLIRVCDHKSAYSKD